MQRAALSLFLLSSGLFSAHAATGTPPTASALDACVLPAGPLPTLTRAVFVLDTSGSMRGLGDGRADIFDRVKGELNRYVRAAQPDRVELMTFDGGLRSRQGFDRPAGTQPWNAALAALKADGNSTYLYRSLRAALAPLAGRAQYLSTVFVLTDGIDNDDLRPVTAAQALAAFARRGPLDRLHYLALGTQIPADARVALQASDYASGLTVPLKQVPRLDSAGLGSTLLRVTEAGTLAVPFADGTRVQLAPPGGGGGDLHLASDVVSGAQVTLSARRPVPQGTAALLCVQEGAVAPPPAPPGSVAARPLRVLLRLKGASPLTLLNPGADLALAQGEEAVLRYRAASGTALDGLALRELPPGLTAELSRRPGAREFSLRLTNRSLPAGQSFRPRLTLPSGAEEALPVVQGRAGGRTPYAAPGTQAQPPAASEPQEQTQVQPAEPGRETWDQAGRWATLISGLEWLRGLVLLALGAGLLVWLRRRRQQPAARPHRSGPGAGPGIGTSAGPGVRLGPPPARQDQPPGVEGIEYSAGRMLLLVAATGEVTGIPIPLGGPFDLGQLARVPHLSGLRAEQQRDGLSILRVPADLEVSQGARLVEAGDVVRPGTLLGVAVAHAGRAPQPPLGTLTGLGLPLTLRHDAASVRAASVWAAGPYGQHTVTLAAGLNDLGTAFGAPALEGLQVTLSGPQLLLVELSAGLRLRRSGETAALQPGSYLPELTLVDLPDA